MEGQLRPKTLGELRIYVTGILTLPLIMLGLLSCRDSGTQSTGQFSIRTGEPNYLVSQPIAVSISNLSGGAVNVATCCTTNPDLRVQQRIDSAWTLPGICALRCVSYPLPMNHTDLIVDTLQIDSAGSYRLMLRFTSGTWNPVNDSAFSNEFEVN